MFNFGIMPQKCTQSESTLTPLLYQEQDVTFGQFLSVELEIKYEKFTISEKKMINFAMPWWGDIFFT